jgi:hypothetical protein
MSPSPSSPADCAHRIANANLILGGELDPVRFALPLLVDCLLTVRRDQCSDRRSIITD